MLKFIETINSKLFVQKCQKLQIREKEKRHKF